MTSPDQRSQTRHGYDVVAEDYARLLRGLTVETALDIAMIDDFGARCLAAHLGAVADIGCGPGRVTAHLAERGLDLLGIDVSPGMIDVARRTHSHLRFEVGAMEELDLEDATLGGVLTWYSLIHTAPSDLPAIVGELARVLKPGGWLLTAFQAGNDERVQRSTAYGRSVTMTNYRHDPEHMITVLEGGGFDLHARLHRSAEGAEKTPQAILLARRQP